MNVTVVTGTRADYGLLFWLMRGIQNDNYFKLDIIVTGSHLSELHGNSYIKIEEDGFKITKKVKILQQSDKQIDIAKSTSIAIDGFSNYFNEFHTDIVILLGDRYEALAAAVSAMFFRVPILHIHGGEVTSGAYDDMIRHSITKLSKFHATTTEEHKLRVIQLGENPENVRNLGAPGLENFKRTNLLDKEELSREIGFDLKNFFLFTYHPETLSSLDVELQITNILAALEEFKDYNVIFTYPNADDGGSKIINSIADYVHRNSDRCLALPTMGQKNYFSALNCCDLVVGNSSSGIIEAPSAKVPTVNIGNRQLNRTAASSVIHSENNTDSIIEAINIGLSKEFKNQKEIYNNPYGDGRTSEKIVSWLKKLILNEEKIFYDSY